MKRLLENLSDRIFSGKQNSHINSDYTYLDQFINAYFHQDCYDEGETDEQIMAEYMRVTSQEEKKALEADIITFLADSKDAYQRVLSLFSPSIILGDNNEQVRIWLQRRLKQLQNSP